MFYTFGNHTYSFSSITLLYSWFGRHISFSLYMTKTFEFYTYVPIQSTNATDVFSDSHEYSTFVSHIFPSHLWYLKYSVHDHYICFNFFPNAYDVFTVIHIYCTFVSHICSSPSKQTYVFLVWQTDFIFLIYASNFSNYTQTCIYAQY